MPQLAKKALGGVGGIDKVPISGFLFNEKLHYDRINTGATKKNFSFAKTNRRSELGEGGTAWFSIQLAHNELICFRERPIFIEYRVKVKNANYKANATAEEIEADKTITHEYIYCNRTSHPGAVINPLTSLAPIFSGVTIAIDNHVIVAGTQFGGMGHIYRALNKIMSTKQDQIRDDVYPYLQESQDRDYEHKTDGFKKGATLACSGLDDKPLDNDCLMVELSYDGIPLLGLPRNNAVANLDKSQNVNKPSYIGPGILLDIQLHLSSAFGSIIDWTKKSSDANYFTDEKPTGENEFINAKIEIASISLGYETYIPSTDKLRQELNSAVLKFHQDKVGFNYYHIPDGILHNTTTLYVPSKALVGYVNFAFVHQLWPDKASKRNPSARFQFPPNLRNLRFELLGTGNLIAENIGPTKGKAGYLNPVLRGYVSNLNAEGVTDMPFDKFCQNADLSPNSYNQVFFFDLRPYDVSTQRQIIVHYEFDGDGSPKNLLFC